jgi:hypothetical protein
MIKASISSSWPTVSTRPSNTTRYTWHHVPTAYNPADIGSRGGNVVNNELWRKGATWLSNPSEWPPHKRLEATPETKATIEPAGHL